MYKIHVKSCRKTLIVQLKLCNERFHRASYLWHKFNFSHSVMCELVLVENTRDMSTFAPKSNGTRTPCQLEGLRVLLKKCTPVIDQEAHYLLLHTNNICSVHNHEILYNIYTNVNYKALCLF